MPWAHIINDLSEEETVGTFNEKELQKTNQKQFKIEKIINRKESKLYVKWKGYNNSFNSGIDIKGIILMNEYFPKPKSLGANVKVELDLSSYCIIIAIVIADLKNAIGVDTTSFAKKTDLANLKFDVDK